MSVKKNRTTIRQFEVLIDYLEQNQELVQSKSFKQNVEKWKKLRDVLNYIGKGPAKSVKEWKRVLIEWKYNTKRKVRNQLSDKNQNVKPLNSMEKRLLNLLKEKPFETVESNELPFVQILVEGNYDDEQKNKKQILPSVVNESKETVSSVLKKALMQNLENSQTTTDYAIKECELTANKNNGISYNKRRKMIIRKEIQANKSMTLRRKHGRIFVSKIKSLMALTEANFRLVDSNLKVAESNCKIAASNEKLADALKFFTEIKLKELKPNNII